MKLTTNRLVTGVIISLLFAVSTLSIAAQDKPKLSGEAREARRYALAMLDEMGEILKEHYYDTKYKGIDVKARLEAAKTRVKSLEFNWQMYRVLAQVLLEFDDSHTFFILPPRTDHFRYGVSMQMIGDDCLVTQVAKDSDARSKGLEPGDQILKISRYKPTRADLWKINYVIYRLDPNKTLDLQVRKPDGTEKTISIDAKSQTDKEFRAEMKARKEKNDEFEPFKCKPAGKDVVACKLYSFSVEKSSVDKMMKEASKYPKMILDLRGNGGGYVDVEVQLLSYFFDHPVKVADMVTREKKETRMTKVMDASKQYKGEVVVLVDSNSASASEMTARVLQLEKRAQVFGDNSSGSVMTSIRVPFRSLMSALADAALISVFMSVTVADVVMKDGSRLENTGVVPDQGLLPTPSAFKDRLDPLLSYAAIKMGAELTPVDAGKFEYLFELDEDEESDSSSGGSK